MQSLDITALLSDFILAGVVLWFSNRYIEALVAQIKNKDERIKELESEVSEANDRHIADLRDWSGIDPKFKTWQRPPMPPLINAESDTNIRNQLKPP